MPSRAPQHSSMPLSLTSWQVSQRSSQVWVVATCGKNDFAVSRLWL